MAGRTQGGGIGRSGLLLGMAKLWFIVSAYAITVGLTHLVEPEVYGRYYVVARIIAVPNLVLIYTLLFTVSRPLAAEHGAGFPSYYVLRRRGLKLAILAGGATTLGFLAGSPLIGRLLRDPELVAPVAVVAPISCVYALYAVNIGTLNALRKFHLQASLDIFMATAKAGLILAAAAAGFGLAMTIGGFTAASILSLGLSVILISRARPALSQRAPGTGDQDMLGFAGILVFFTAAVNTLQSVDVLLVKRFVEDAAVGFYSSAQGVALVPFSLMNAVSLLMFPLIAAIEESGDRDRVRSYVTETAKVTLLLLCLMASVGAAASSEIQALLFPAAYERASGQLAFLVWGFAGYSFTVTSAWVLNSTQRTRPALALVALPLVVVTGLSLVLIPSRGPGGAALAVAVAGGLATVGSLAALKKFFDVGLPMVHLFKLALAVGVVVAAAHGWPDMETGGLKGKLAIVGKLGALTVAFVGVVVATRAVTMADIRGLRSAS